MHALFAPSSSQRTIDCPASLLLNAAEPDNQSVDAAHGTAAHFIGALCLSKKVKTEKYAGCTVIVTPKGKESFAHEKHQPAENDLTFEVDDEMQIGVQEYVDWCNELPGEHFVEVRVDISHWCPKEEQYGTSDHIAHAGRILYVTDLKYGKGVQVFAKENTQGILYALGALRKVDVFDEVEEIHIRICQPRLDHKDVWIVSREDLLRWGDYIRERFTLALSENPPFGPTEKACKFCKVAARCRALADHLTEVRALAFDDLDQDFVEPDVRLLNDYELVEAWRMHGLFKLRFAAIEKEMMKAMLNDVTMPGLRLVASNTHRRWRNPREAALFLQLDYDLPREKIYSQSLISPAEAEKHLPKALRKTISALVIKPPGGPCIVDADDKRPDYKASSPVSLAEDVFDNLDE